MPTLPRPCAPCHCSVDCHSNHYADASGKCQRCMDGCDDCKSADKCDSCSEGFHRTQNGTCVPCTDKVGRQQQLERAHKGGNLCIAYGCTKGERMDFRPPAEARRAA